MEVEFSMERRSWSAFCFIVHVQTKIIFGTTEGIEMYIIVQNEKNEPCNRR